jgi:hypothetical protein
MGALASIDLETLRKGRRRTSHATDSARAAQIVVHADRVEPALGRQDAWHFSARQLDTLVSGPIGWTTRPREEASVQPEAGP